MITICLAYFKSLTLANLAASLYSVRRQDLSLVWEIVIVDNDTMNFAHEIRIMADALAFPVPVRVMSFKHGFPSRTHAWSTNVAVREAQTSWVLFTRADYLLSFDLLRKFSAVIDAHPNEWNGFITSNGCHLGNFIGDCERTQWRIAGPELFRGAEFDYTSIDSGVWMARRDAFERVGGLDEHLTAWGHAQTQFQWKMHQAGVEFVRIPETLFWHPQHAYSAPKDMDLAGQQLRELGVSLKEMWARYHGVSPY